MPIILGEAKYLMKEIAKNHATPRNVSKHNKSLLKITRGTQTEDITTKETEQCILLQVSVLFTLMRDEDKD